MNKTIINHARIKKLHNMEHIEFHLEFGNTVRDAGPDAHRCADLLPKYDARYATLDTELKRIIKSPRTAELQQADKEREDTYRGLVGFNKAMTLHHDSLVRAAAGRIVIVIETYGNVTNLNYEEETGVIDNLVQDLKSVKYAPDAVAVGLTPWVLKLEERNNRFKTLMNSRDQETAASEHHIAVREARVRIDDVYYRVRDRMNSYVDDETVEPALDALITQLNIIIKRFNTIVARRESAGKKDGEGTNDGVDGGASGEPEETEE